MRLGPMHNKLLLSDLFYPLCNILVGSLFVQPLIDLYRMSWSNGDKESYNCSFLMSVGLVCCPNNFSLFLFSSSKKSPKHCWSSHSITLHSGPKPYHPAPKVLPLLKSSPHLRATHVGDFSKTSFNISKLRILRSQLLKSLLPFVQCIYFGWLFLQIRKHCKM